MAIPKKASVTVYKCSWCGTTQARPATIGRPDPGNCPRRPKMRDGKMMPHRWTISYKF